MTHFQRDVRSISIKINIFTLFTKTFSFWNENTDLTLSWYDAENVWITHSGSLLWYRRDSRANRVRIQWHLAVVYAQRWALLTCRIMWLNWRFMPSIALSACRRLERISDNWGKTCSVLENYCNQRQIEWRDTSLSSLQNELNCTIATDKRTKTH